MNPSVIETYKKQYVDIGFERAELFKTIARRFACTDVLYPGCSTHITPSFFFPHVVYVDQSPAVAKFFADFEPIQSFVNRKKQYKRRAYIRFIAQDYTGSLDLQDESFDLLISLYAGSVSQACKGYLKPGGLLLTNHHQDNVTEALNDACFHLKSVVRHTKGGYRFFDEELDAFLPSDRNEVKVKNYLKSTSRGAQYREEVDHYFIFEKRAC
ncbi:MAG: class I SAM-dependent methyltransferase [Anaerolineales bacterium]|nr:class I SAM-dependent methyltransferase [Anaerolineales bacterium]